MQLIQISCPHIKHVPLKILDETSGFQTKIRYFWSNLAFLTHLADVTYSPVFPLLMASVVHLLPILQLLLIRRTGISAKAISRLDDILFQQLPLVQLFFWIPPWRYPSFSSYPFLREHFASKLRCFF